MWLYGFSRAYALNVWLDHPMAIPLAGKAVAIVFLVLVPALVRSHFPVPVEPEQGS